MTNALAAHQTSEIAALADHGLVTIPATRAELIAEAGKLNNDPSLVNVDHVTFMGFMDRDECEEHVAKLRARIGEAA